MNKDIARIETEIMQLNSKLEKLRRENPPTPVKNYTFEGPHGSVELLKLFGSKNKLILIHNMGQGCRWCTSWADGINAMLPHLENSFSVALVSKDPPELQRQFALARGWRFQMLSHGGGSYINEQGVVEGGKNDPGIVCYERSGDKILRKNSTVFGPGDCFNPLFHIVSLAGVGMEEFTPQFQYWKRPEKMDDGGANL